MDISDVLKKYSEIPLERFQIVCRFEDLAVPSLRRAIIFIFAVWSGPAIIGFKRFTRVLAGLDVRDVELIVVDTDCLSPRDGAALWGRSVGGAGETIWVRDGKVTARSLSSVVDIEPELIRHTKDLLHDESS